MMSVIPKDKLFCRRHSCVFCVFLFFYLSVAVLRVYGMRSLAIKYNDGAAILPLSCIGLFFLWIVVGAYQSNFYLLSLSYFVILCLVNFLNNLNIFCNQFAITH